jgi:pimeloyl-ACP methyl ester carboxylesterase
MKLHRRMLTLALIALCLVFALPYAIPIPNSGVPTQDLAGNLALEGGRFITVDGLQTYVVERGSPQGKPILFLHGLFGSTFSARYQLQPFADAGYRVIAYDRPGFGLTDKPYAFHYSLAQQADFAAHVLDALEIPQAIIWGHSAGGAVLTQFALRHPNRVEQLLIVDGFILGEGQTKPALSAALSIPPVYRWAQLGVRGWMSEQHLADALPNFYANPADVTPETVRGYWRSFETTHWEHGGLGHFRDATDGQFSEAQLRSIRPRAILIWGEQDTITVLADGDKLAALLPNATLLTITNAGHLPMEETPAVFNRMALHALSTPLSTPDSALHAAP